MQSPRSAAAVSLPLLQRSGLSASHPDPVASLETAGGLSSSPSHLLSSVSTPRQEYCWSGVDAAEAPQFSHAQPSTALMLHSIAGGAGNTGIAGVQLEVLDPPAWAVSTAFRGKRNWRLPRGRCPIRPHPVHADSPVPLCRNRLFVYEGKRGVRVDTSWH